ncbi:MAG TPA: TM0106 family RecB-like putative nuclease [Candidatus Eisenbacteria bacterium]|nr:TM0106 family RecB-like putative nuclease [Candidatus Eisenbacteria bacterium]
MRASGKDPAIGLAATDLANHLACRHLTSLDLAAARGQIEPPRWKRPGLDALRERGMAHERAYLAHLDGQGLSWARAGEVDSVGAAWTLEAMKAGVDVIVQAPLGEGRFRGRADVLRKVDRPSALGAWSYEPVDTKLARETRAGTILQLVLYADLLQPLQGIHPERLHVVSPRSGFEPESFRVEDFLAYYRWVRRRLEAAVDAPQTEAYPEPVPHCDLCRWWPRCDRKRHDDDHLSIVAGISRLQRRELEARGISTLESLASLALPLPWSPRRGTRRGYERVREQARVQLEGRREGRRRYELLDLAPDQGLARLQAPSPGDLFLDLEGDPYVGEHGIEYLFGLAFQGSQGEPVYVCEWATNADEERTAFERLIDTIMIHWDRDPDLHVFHYGAYDPAALRRLMGRYARREREVDRLLRAGRFVDLLPIVRQTLRASVEHYSIKDLEPFFGFSRTLPLREASWHRSAIEHSLELGGLGGIDPDARHAVEAYNRDDCVSAMRLRDWLEGLRSERIRGGAEIARPVAVEDGAPNPDLDERERRTQALAARLASGVPADRDGRTREQNARSLLADLLEWHRREEKAPWWEYFRLRDLTDDELMDERSAIAGLEFVGPIVNGGRKLERYAFPPQETQVREEDELHTRLGKAGEVAAMHLEKGLVDILRPRRAEGTPLVAAFRHKMIHNGTLAAALFRIGQWVDEHGIDAPGAYRAGRDLLLGLPPRLRAGASLEGGAGAIVDAARRVGMDLDQGTLVIQGPPGAGKTYTSAHMICDLVAAGRRVGISAQSHKVIRNLLLAVLAAAASNGQSVPCLQKVRKPSDDEDVPETTENEPVRRALEEGSVKVAGGTAWMWSREEFHEAVDVLFVDEAGQMSLANALACSQGARSLVLVGDPQQLEQPIQGSHPEGSGVSALEHVLGGHKTLPADRGLFLDETWRLHPTICAFTSEQFYEGRLRSRPSLERQAIDTPRLTGAGLWFLPVEHQGNTTASVEEVAAAKALVEDLLSGSSTWTDADGSRPLTLDDVLVVAPYNAQVADLLRALPGGARVGTVDRFQGQEAPVVIVSMATSSPEDAPRGMEFLYSLDRLNVATSRAKAACILIASPRLFEPDCGSPRQMQLANAFCRYLEQAATLALEVTPSTA